MKEIVFATNNAHKLREIREITGPEWRVLSLTDIGCNEDIPETADTLQGNAALKACYIRDKYGYDCFADDTGLMSMLSMELPASIRPAMPAPDMTRRQT